MYVQLPLYREAIERINQRSAVGVSQPADIGANALRQCRAVSTHPVIAALDHPLFRNRERG
jgi:hypothetical protein